MLIRTQSDLERLSDLTMIDAGHADKLKDERGRGRKGEQTLHVIPFKGLRQLGASEEARRDSGLKVRLGRPWDRATPRLLSYFEGEGLVDKLCRALAAREAIDMKELAESFEFFTHARKKQHGMRSGVVCDLCCGHGFTALLFAVFERGVERVVLVDRMRPPAFDKIWEAVLEVAPWAEAKVDLTHFGTPSGDLARLAADPLAVLPVGCSILAVHACGGATDMCIEVGLKVRARAMAIMPCCHRAASLSRKNKVRAMGRRRKGDVEGGEERPSSPG